MNRSTSITAVVVGLVAALAGPAAVGSAAPASSINRAGSSDPVARELQDALDDVVAAGATGVMVRVDDGRRTYRLASGQAQLDPPLQMRPEAKIKVGSITKSFVSTIALQLVGERELGLDDTVEKWQPGLIPNGGQITLRELLNHTSGLFNYTEDDELVDRVTANPLLDLQPADLIAVANAHPPLFAPGTSWSYSNTNYIVVGLILEQVTHRSISELIDERIVHPLRLRHTFFPAHSPVIPGYHAHGYYPPAYTDEGYLDVTHLSPSWAWAAGALVSNVDDLRWFYRALLRGKLLKPAQLTEMKTLVPLEDGFGYGLGLYRMSTPCGPVWGHDGGVPGYITIAWSDEAGKRDVLIGLPTQPDEPIDEAFGHLIGVAACRSLGQALPPMTAAARTAGPAGNWLQLVDRSRGLGLR